MLYLDVSKNGKLIGQFGFSFYFMDKHLKATMGKQCEVIIEMDSWCVVSLGNVVCSHIACSPCKKVKECAHP